jgi:hypothetical protein
LAVTTRMRASTTAPAIGAAPVSGDELTLLAVANGLMMTGAAAAGISGIRPGAINNGGSLPSDGLQADASPDKPTTIHETDHLRFITLSPPARTEICEAEDSRRRATHSRADLDARSYRSVRSAPRAVSAALSP